MKTIISLLLLLAVVKLIHCQEHEQMIVLTLQGILQNLESINGQLKGHDELLQRIPDMQQKFQHLENNLQDVQEKLEHLENNLQELHHELEHVKGLSQETGQLLRREVLEHLTNVSAAAKEEIKSYVHEEISGVISLAQGHDELLQRIPDMQEKLQHLENNLQDVQQEQGNQKTYFQGLSRETAQCLKGEDLEHLTNVSAAANQEIKSFHEEMSEVIAWSRKDKCSEGSLLCGKSRTCKNNPFSFTCSCPSGFTWNGSECKDVDECAEGKDDCVPNATCKNSIGSYSCSCNKPFEGDGRTSCECRSPAKKVTGLGCLILIQQPLPFNDGKKKCEEEGGRLAQHMTLEQLQDMVGSFIYVGGWVGVYDGKWMNDGSLVPEDLWWEGDRSDPSRRCGFIDWENLSSPYKLNQRDCSDEGWGYCQFPMP